MAIGQEKKAPNFLTKWEKDNKISSYHWVDTWEERDHEGKKIKVRVNTKRSYGVNHLSQLVRFPKEIEEYFNGKTAPEAE